MFKIEETIFGKITQYHLRNNDTGEYVSVLPSYGGTLNQVGLVKNGIVHELLDGCTTYEELISEGRNKFKGSKLFPFPNRVKDGRYSFEDKVYNLPINFPHENNAIHGIVLKSNFTVVEQTISNQGVSITITYTTTGKEEGYPFKTTININYALDKEGFSCKTTIVNIDTKNVPIGDGWHPYFKTGSTIDNCLLSIPVECSYEVDRRMIPTGRSIKELFFTKATKILSTQFDTCYKLANSEDTIFTTILVDPELDLSLIIWQEGGEGKYNYLQLYIPADRQSIAIEPMSCLTDSFNNKEGLLVLAPGETRNFLFGLKLE